MKIILNFLKLVVFISFCKINCIQEEKLEHENKNEFENLKWKKSKIIDCCSGIFEKNSQVFKVITLSNKRLAIALSSSSHKIKIFNIETEKFIKNLSNRGLALYIKEIPNQRLISINKNKKYDDNVLLFKIWNLNSYKLSKKIKLMSPDIASYDLNILYLTSEKILIILTKILITIDLKSYQVDYSYNNIGCLYKIEKFNNGSFIASHPDKLLFFDKDFNLDESSTISLDTYELYILNNDNFISRNLDSEIILWQNQNIKTIKKILEKELPIEDLQKIILDYIGDNWQKNNIVKNEEMHKPAILAISDKILISQCNCSRDVKLLNLETLKRSFIPDNPIKCKLIVAFQDNTFVLASDYDMIIYKPVIS